MTWFRLDDGFWSHPKTSMLSDSAVALWVRAGSYCCQHLTDGVVPKTALRLLGKPAAAKELVTAGLWDVVEGGWSFHDWHEYQETSTAVKQRREDARERQRKAREAKALRVAKSQQMSHVTEGVTDSVTSQEVRSPHAAAVARGSRPDPTRPEQHASRVAASGRDEPPADDPHVPAEIENAAQPPPPSKPSSTELAFLRLHLGQQLPRPVEQALVVEVRKLRRFDTPVIEAALRAWSVRPDARPGLLPHLAADVLKRPNAQTPPSGESKADIWTTSVINPADQAAADQQRRLA